MVESTKNKKTLKKVDDDVVKTKTTKNKGTLVKSSEVGKVKETTKKINKIEKVEKTLKSDKKEEKQSKKQDEKNVKKHEKEESEKRLETKKEEGKKTKAENLVHDEKIEKALKKVKSHSASHKVNNHDENINKTKKSGKKSFWSIKDKFLDVSLLYKNFFHWNASKILIFFWSIALGFLSVLPIILVFIVYAFFSHVNVGQLIGGIFSGTLLNDFFGNVILMLIVFVFVIIYSYSNLLLINVSNSYLEGKKLAYKKNDYFDFKKVVKFFNLTIINFLILLIPFLSFGILMWILLQTAGGLDKVYTLVSSSPINYITISSFILLFAGLVGFFYLGYRTLFSYFVYLEESHISKKVKVLDCIKESFSKTKKIKSFFKFILVVVVFLIITLPIKFVGVILDNNLKMVNDYSVYKGLTEEQKEYISNSNNSYYYQSLEVEFKGFSDDKLKNISNKNEIYMLLFSILSFLFLNGLFLMILASFYKRELQ